MKVLYIADLGENLDESRANEDFLYSQLLEQCKSEEITLSLISDDLSTEDPAHVLAKGLLDGIPDLIVGKGFAGVFALLIGRATKSRTILVNPMYPVYRYLPYELPDYKFTKLLNSFEFDKLCWDDEEDTLDNVFVILAEDDDVIDTKRTAEYFCPGNSIYVPGGTSLVSEDFKKAFAQFLSHFDDDPDAIRKILDLYKEEGAFCIEETDATTEETLNSDGKSESPKEVVLPGNDRLVVDMRVVLENDNEEIEDDYDPDLIVVEGLKSENGNIVIKWRFANEEDQIRYLYLYYKDGTWYRDEEDGRRSSDSILVAVMKKAAKSFFEQTEMTGHIGQDFWGWVW